VSSETLLPPPPNGHPARPSRQPGEAGVGWTVTDLARRYRVSEAKVLRWIAEGQLRALNTAPALCQRARWVVTAEALAEFERSRASTPPPRPPRRRRKREMIDYYP
jgi:hypothetical protein